MDLCQTIVSILASAIGGKRLQGLPLVQQAYYLVEFHIADHYPRCDISLLRREAPSTDQQARLAYELQRANADRDVVLLQLLLQLNQVLAQQPPDVVAALGVNLHDVRANQVTISDVYVTHIQGRQPPEPGSSPYKGMKYFEVDDAELFFGRGELIAELVDYLHNHRFLAVVGASGSGKSSLVRAGLIATLQGQKELEGSVNLPPGSRSWRYIVTSPTSRPLNSLAEALVSQGGLNADPSALAGELLENRSSLGSRMQEVVAESGSLCPNSQKVMLIIDQFEEIFTLNQATSPATTLEGLHSRQAFVDNLLAAADASAGPTVVIVIIRVDFYGQCAQFDNLRARLGDLQGSYQKFIGAMSKEELRQAITRPLEIGNWTIEPELVDQLLYDLGSEPGTLPLLSHALLETWNRRSGRLLTLVGYVATGRIQGAIAKTAEAVYRGQLTERQRSIARNLFLRLTEPGTLDEGTRRRVDMAELYSTAIEQEEVRAVLQILSEPKCRLVVLRADQVEVAHEALLREWPRLREWIDDHQLAHRQLLEVSRAAKAWSEHGHAADWIVHQGARLASTAILTEYSALPLSQIEQNYLAECRMRQQDLDSAREDMQLADVSYAGWGIIFPATADAAAVKDALSELLTHRRSQAGDLYREFTGPDGYRPGETAKRFLARHGVASGRGDPSKVPHYLLLVGDPENIPFSFQYQLDVQLAAGRVQFDTLEQYADYAHSVVTVERGKVTSPRRAVFFGVQNPEDRATRMSASRLVIPLADMLDREYFAQWEVETIVGEEANKRRLSELIGGKQSPALLFTAGHGLGFPEGHAQQAARQGALVCSDWPGPRQTRSPLSTEFYFCADDVADNSRLLGSIFFFWSCYSAGTTQIDSFASRRGDGKPQRIASRAFLSELPKRLLCQPGGGALAVIGRVERTWQYSFISDKLSDLDAFRRAIGELMRERPVGLALKPFKQRYLELSSTLVGEMEKGWMGEAPDPNQLAILHTAAVDARNYVVVGDPAVRLRGGDTYSTPPK